MNPPPPPTLYKRHRFPAAVISHCVWLYFHFCLSYRDVEELMAERGVTLTDEVVRYWCRKFGQTYANQCRHRRPGPGDTWHLDEVFLSINGERHYLWRAIDRDGHVLDILVRRRRDTHAAKRCFRHLLKGLTDIPRGIITDKLRSYSAAKREMLPSVDHRQQHYLNNRAENSHQPTRQRERRMPRFTSPWPRTTVPLCLWADRLPFPSQTSPAACPGLPPGNAATISGLARGDRHTASGLKDTGGSTLSLRGLVIALDSVNLTKPGIARSAVAI